MLNYYRKVGIMMSAYFESDGKYISPKCEKVEFYIPKSYFDTSNRFAENYGDIIKAIGIFDIGVFDRGNLKEMKVLNLPTWIDFFVVHMEERDVDLPSDGLTPCVILTYLKGQKIMNDSIVQDTDNVAAYLAFITKGKVPSIVPYDKSIDIWRKNQSMNNGNFGVRPEIEELILGTSYRWKENPNIKFSHVIGKDLKVSQYDYVMNNLRQICQYTSTFNGLTFEDMDTMITTSLNRTRNKGEEVYSPVEVLLKL